MAKLTKAEKQVEKLAGFRIDFWNNRQVCSYVIPKGRQPYNYSHITAEHAIKLWQVCVDLQKQLNERG